MNFLCSTLLKPYGSTLLKCTKPQIMPPTCRINLNSFLCTSL